MVPLVSIVVPCLDEERYIEPCLRDLLAQDYPADRFEVVVADGGSHDRTRAILEEVARRDARVHVVDNPERIQAAGLNAAIRAAHGDVLVRADVHAEYARDYVSSCVEVLGETGAANVGGAARPVAKTAFQRAVCAALRSPLAFGGSKYRDARNEGWVESVFPGAFRRDVLERVGLFDPHAVTNEDAEINQRIWESGERVWLSRRIVVRYFPRDSLRGLAQQYFRYGEGRARTLWKHRGLPSIRPVVPFLALLGELALLGLAPGVGAAALLAYGAATAFEAVRVGHALGLAALPRVWACFPVMHASHAIGVAVGLARYGLAPDWEEASPSWRRSSR